MTGKHDGISLLNTATLLALGLCPYAGLRAATVTLPGAPSGFSNLPSAPSGFYGGMAQGPQTSGGAADRILRGFSFSTSLSGTYDSNITQSPGLPTAPIEDDFFLTMGLSANYLSKGSNLTFGGNYHGSYNQYFNHSEYSGFDQGAGVAANYDGGRLTAAFTAGVEFTRGNNRYYSSTFVEQTNFSTSLSLRYRLSPKTSLAGNIGETFTTASGGFQDTQAFDMGVSALWKYSPLTEFGPGVRYTYRSDGSETARTSVGPTLSMNYKLSTKVSLTSRVGMDFVSYEDGGSADATVSASIGLDYRASKLWGMNLSLYRDSQADPTVAGSFYEITALRLGYNRKVRRAMLNVGTSFESTTSERAGTSGGSSPDREHFSFDTSLSMPILSNTTSASIFVRYSDQSSSAADSWDAVQMGFSLSRSF